MRNLFLSFLATIFLLLCIVQPCKAQNTSTEQSLRVSALPQAKPVYNLLKAVKTSDFKLYQTVWAKETLKMYNSREKYWSRIRKEHVKMFRENLGRYRLKDLRFHFRKEYDSGAGVVFIIYKGEQRTGFNVIEENGEWKIREM